MIFNEDIKMSFEQFLEESVVENEEVEQQEEVEQEDELNEAAKKAKKSFTVKFNVENAAFEDDFEGEVEFVLKQAIKNIQRGTLDKPLRDTNGNDVGSVK